MINHSFLFIFVVMFNSCASQKMAAEEKQVENSDSLQIVSVPIVEKPFYNKAGKKMDFTEFYIQQSVQDYFIKFCESQVTRKQLEEALSKIESPIKTLTLKIEIRDGEWDSCEDFPVQSRIGKYVILHSIE